MKLIEVTRKRRDDLVDKVMINLDRVTLIKVDRGLTFIYFDSSMEPLAVTETIEELKEKTYGL